MRAAVCCLLVVGLLMPTVAQCIGTYPVVRAGSSRDENRSMSLSGEVGQNGPTVTGASDDGFWLWVIRVVVAGAVWDGIKWVVRKTAESPPKPALGGQGAWQDDPPCGGVGLK